MRSYYYITEWLKFQFNKEPVAWLTLILTAIGVLVAYFQYAQPYIEQLNAPPNVNLDCKIEDVGDKNGLTALQGTLDVDNISSKRVFVTASWFEVDGFALSRHKSPLVLEDIQSYGQKVTGYFNPPREDFRSANDYADRHGFLLYSRIPKLYSRQDLIVSGKVLDRGYWMDAGSKSAIQFITYVPQGEYDKVRLSAGVFVTKDKSSHDCYTKVTLDGNGNVNFDTKVRGIFPWSGYQTVADSGETTVTESDGLCELSLWPNPKDVDLVKAP